MTGGVQEEGAKEEEEEVRTVNKELVGPWATFGASTPPFPSRTEEELVGHRHTGHRGICLRKTIILDSGRLCLVLSGHMRNRKGRRG